MKVFNFFILPKGAVSRDSKSQMLSNLKIRPPSLPNHSCCLKSITCSNVHIGFLIFLDVGFDIIQMNNWPRKVASRNCLGFAIVVQKYMHSDPGVFMDWLVDSTYINPHPLEADHQANPKGYQEGDGCTCKCNVT